MGIYSGYLDQRLTVEQIGKLRKQQLKRISDIRGRAIFVYASDFVSPMKAPKGVPVALDASDILPVSDQLDNLAGDEIDVVLETPGGNGTVADDIVHILRKRFKSVAFIVPGQAKSAGTIMVMSGDEILMDHRSAVGRSMRKSPLKASSSRPMHC
jgi:ClpP class serine protease